MSIEVSKARVHIAGEYPVRRAVRYVVKLKEPDRRTGITHQGFVLWRGLALLVVATGGNAVVWYHWNIPPGSIRKLIREEEGLRTFQIGVAFGFGLGRTITVVAEHATEAVITGLYRLGMTTLSGVTGISICEL